MNGAVIGDKSELTTKGKQMKKRKLRPVFALVVATIPVVGCTPAFDGITEGLTDGLSAATSAFVEELVGALVGDVVSNSGA